jgi:hypothetical protein
MKFFPSILLSAALLWAPAARAQYLSKEPFAAYTAGNELQAAGNPTIPGYTGGWTDIDYGDAEPAVVSGSLIYGNASYAGASGDRVAKGADAGAIAASNSGRVFRLLDSSLTVGDATTGTLYLSWLFRTGNENTAANPNTYQTLALYNGDTADANRNFDAGIASGDFATGNYAFRAKNSSSFRANLGVAPNNAVHLFVAKFNLSAANNGDSVTVWIDPALGGGEPAGGVTRSGFNLQFDRLALADYASNSSAWDEIRWGSTFNSVTVLPAQPLFLQQPSNQTGYVGDTFTFTTEATANPAPSYQWQYSADGNAWSSISGATQPVLSINSAPYSAAGSYRVVATNTNGSTNSSVATLGLTFPAPEITQQPAPVGVEAGENATFTVVASGTGNLSYQWFKGGVEVPGATAATLSLNSVSEADTGVYTVRVTDDAPVSAGQQPVSVLSDGAILILGNLADYESGLTFRLFDIQAAMDQLYPLVPGQTPNVDQKRSTIDWSGSADFAGYSQQFVVECHADLFVPASGGYTFRLTSADGSELWIDDTLVIDHDGEHAATGMEGAITLDAGLHPLKLRFFQNTGDVVLKLEWRTPGSTDFVTVPASSFLTTAGVTRVVAPGKKNVIRPGDGSRPGNGQPLNAVHPSWRVTTIHPSSFNPKVGAMAVHPDGRLLITTFNPNQNHTPDPLPGGDGKVWALTNVQGEDPAAVTVTEVAAGLSEPLGMKFIGGELYVTQRLAVTRLRDTNGDGYYETKENVGSGWVSDNYHQFHFGLVEKDGYTYSTLSTSIHFDYPGLNGPNPPNRGTLVRTNLATGEVTYLAGGLRTPNGICLGPENEIFQTDNQGAWQPTSRLNHLRQGHFYGHYNNTADGGSPSLFSDQPMTQPAVWFPQNEVANSPSQPLSIPDGPFAGDLLVGDITLGGINRVSLEKVHDTWQGCIYRFTHGLEGGVNRLAWGPNGTLYVGCIGGTGNWSWNGTQTGLQRLTPKSGNPVTFEIAKISVTATGFEISYTKPVPQAFLETPANFTAKQWYYQPTAAYGGAKIGEEILSVTSATASADRTKVTLVIPGLKKGHVVYLKSDPVSDDGSAILSSEAWYTLNEIPGGPYNIRLNQGGIPENQPSGTVIGSLAADHDMAGETIVFSLPEGLEDNAYFTLSGGNLVAAGAFDYERRSAYQVRVRATDESGLVSESDVTVQVTDIAEEHPPRRILLSNAVLPPDHTSGALVGRMMVDDQDLGDLQTGALSSAAATSPVVYEGFDYSAGTSQPGQSGGSGFSEAWQVSGTASTIPAGSLSYTDGSGMALEVLGNRGFSSPLSRNHRALSTARGTDGTVTYASFLADPGSNVHFWGIEFWNGTAADANRVLQLGNESGFGVRVRNATNKFFAQTDSGAHFFVVKIEHLAGNDQVSVWIDPPLGAEPSSPDLLFTPSETGGSIAFNRIGFSDYVTTSAPAVDEVRIDNDWNSVTPHHPAYPRFEFVAGAGDEDNAAFTIHGDQLVAASTLSAGLHSVRVKATDSAGLSFNQALRVWVGAGNTDTNNDGVTDGDAVRLGFDPSAPGAQGAYFGGSDPFSSLSTTGGQLLLEAPALPGNLYWIESSPDLAQWTLEPQSVVTPDSFEEIRNRWQIERPLDPKYFWRIGGGWPQNGGINPLANGLAGLTFIGGEAGWTYDSASGILRHDTASPSEWVHFGQTFGDFLLSLEYRLSSGGNAGVFLRATVAGDPWLTGSEIQLTNEPRLPIHSTGAVYDRIAASPAADASHSVWHRMEILMISDRLRVAVDGVTTVDVADVHAAYPAFNWPETGLIGLQNSHASIAGTIEYRNIRVIPVTP